MIEELLSGVEVIQKVNLGLQANGQLIKAFDIAPPVKFLVAPDPLPGRSDHSLKYAQTGLFHFGNTTYFLAVGNAPNAGQHEQSDFLSLQMEWYHRTPDSMTEREVVEIFREYAEISKRNLTGRSSLIGATSTGHLTFSSETARQAFLRVFPNDTFISFSAPQQERGEDTIMRYHHSIVDHIVQKLPIFLEGVPSRFYARKS
ncbi:MAG TPA: hypothetical protein VJI15_00680 [Candidatus Nanoarchaeia archaeon]|nr:hypothetical protein [Candidatus Nanoarchaeia archaeon]